MADRSPEVLSILVKADAVWESAMGNQTDAGSISEGTHPLFAALLAGEVGGGAVVSASSFWESEPDYGTPDSARREYLALRGTNLAPGVSKGQHL